MVAGGFEAPTQGIWLMVSRIEWGLPKCEVADSTNLPIHRHKLLTSHSCRVALAFLPKAILHPGRRSPTTTTLSTPGLQSKQGPTGTVSKPHIVSWSACQFTHSDTTTPSRNVYGCVGVLLDGVTQSRNKGVSTSVGIA